MLRLLRATLVAFVLLPAVAAQAAPVVVSEFRFRGPNGAADEYIELRNTSASPQAIGGWLVQGCNSGGTISTRATIDDGVTLPPGGSYLLTNSSASGGPYSGSVPGDQTFATGITDTGGIRLVSQLTPALVVEDAAGSSAVLGTARCREGDGLTGLPTGARTDGLYSFERKAGGTQDTGDNPADFTGPQASDPQNSKGAGSDDAPSVSGSSPANGASNVAPGSTITVTFSEPVAITPSGFTLVCAGQAVDAVTTQSSPTSATVDPTGELPRGQSCSLTIAASAVTDADAQDPPDEMSAKATINFTTEGLRLRIHEIQGAAHRSPYEGRPVDDVPGVVTAVNADGFWMQDTQPDGDDATSEGIFVFRSTPRPAVGDSVTVDGQVQEFRPGGAATFNLTTTEISGSPKVTVVGTGDVEPTVVGPGGRVPPTQIIEDDGTGDVELGGFLFDPAEDGLDFHESLEGMLVSLEAPDVVGPTTSNEELAVLPSGHGSPRTARGGILMRPDDLNPERVILDDAVLLARQPAQTIPPANVGDTLVGPIEAVVDYSFGNPKYLVTSVPVVNHNGLQPEVTEAPRANQLAMASMNVENLAADDPTLSAKELEAKFARLAGQLVTNLRSPDIVAVEEIQDANGTTNNGNVDAGPTYDRFIDAIVDAGGPRYEYRQINPVNNADGGAGGGNIRVGFLFRTDRGVEFVDRPGGTATNETDVVATRKGARLTFSPGRLQDEDPTTFQASRKPLAGEFLWKGRTVIAIANHFNSKGGDDPLFGRRQPPVASSEVQRHKQAHVLADFVERVLAADPRAAVAVLGDLNDFDFSETLDIVEGSGLNNLMDTLPTAERYSYVFDGNSQVLDQILVSDELMTPAPEYDSVHVNAEFADQASDHDPQVARVVVRGTGNANGQ